MECTNHKWYDVGTLKLKKKFIRELALVCAGSFLLQTDLKVQIAPPKFDFPRVLTVESVTENEGSQIVKFKEIDSPNLLQEYDELHCLVRAEVADSLTRIAEEGWTGWIIEDAKNGILGKIKSLQEMPSQVLVEVETQDGDLLELPIVDEFVIEEDCAKQKLRVNLPEYLCLG